MKSFRSIYTSDLYDRYKEIPNRSYLQLIYFVESHQDQIAQLASDQKAELLIDFCYALFETGKHRSFLDYIDPILEMVIEQNIFYHRNEDVFQELLFKKAASHYNLGQLEQSISILKQILYIRPDHKYAYRFLKKCVTEKRREERIEIRAIFIGLLFLAICFSSIKILYIQPFHRILGENLDFLRNASLVVATLGLFLLEGMNFFEVYKFKLRALKNKSSL